MRITKNKTSNLLPAEANVVQFEKVGDHASVHSQAGLIVKYDGVLLPDGTRSGEMRMADPEHLRYRRLDSSEKFVYGKVVHLKADSRKDTKADLVFKDDKDQSIPYSADEQSVTGILSKCATTLKSVSSHRFSDRLFGALAGNTWVFPGVKFVLNARSAGKVVSELRGNNECYMDFFLSGAEGLVQDSTRVWLEGNGFELLAKRNWNSDIKQACELLELSESRPAEPNPPEWFSHWIDMEMGEDDLTKRMHLCCFRGQATLEEWEEFLILLPDYEGIMAGSGRTGKPRRRVSKPNHPGGQG